MTIQEARNNIGRAVIYSSGSKELREHGVITSVNYFFVFVRYAGQLRNASGRATAPGDLVFADEWDGQSK